jgi:hypothetical protein
MSGRSLLAAALATLLSLSARPAAAQRSLDEGVATGLYVRSSSGPSWIAMLLPDVSIASVRAVADLDGDGDRDTLVSFAVYGERARPA